MNDFDFQWQYLPSPNIDLTPARIEEFRNFTQIPDKWFKGKKCLDAGCGSGRYTWVLIQFGAKVTAFDQSEPGVMKCRGILPACKVMSIFDLKTNPVYDFVISWGVLHHTHNPEEAFKKVASQVKPGGILHVYLYHEQSQRRYTDRRKIFHRMKTIPEKMAFVQKFCDLTGEDFHGTWDSLVPEYNWGLNVPTVRRWFEQAGFRNIRVITEVDINMNATKI